MFHQGRLLILATFAISILGIAAEAQLDASFDADGRAISDFGGTYDYPDKILPMNDGRIIVFGSGGSPTWGIVSRYTSNGALDLSLLGFGYRWFPAMTSNCAGAVLSDNRIVFAGGKAQSEPFGLLAVRLLESGDFDPSFGVDGQQVIPFSTAVRVTDAHLDGLGRFWMTGYVPSPGGGWDGFVARLLDSGQPDPDFGAGGVVFLDFSRPGIPGLEDQLHASALLPDGKLIVGGQTNRDPSGSPTVYVLARLLENGAPDQDFGVGGFRTYNFNSPTEPLNLASVNDIELVDYGRIVAAGRDFRGTMMFRVDASGVVDPTFGTAGRVIAVSGQPNFTPMAIAVDAYDRIWSYNLSRSITRFSEEGVVDFAWAANGTYSFNFGTANEYPADLNFQPDGKLVVAGAVGTANVNANWGVARILPGPPPDLHTLTLFPADGEARSTDGGANFTVNLSAVSNFAQEGSQATLRILMEIDLGMIPPGSTILSATLEATVSAFTHGPDEWPALQLDGYLADGLLTPEDATRFGRIVAQSSLVTATGPLAIPLADTGFMTEARDECVRHVGLLISGAVPFHQTGFWAMEAPVQGLRPRLVLTYRDPPCLRDLDGSGAFDLPDLATILVNFGMPTNACLSHGDFDNDRDVDLGDLAYLLAVFGAQCD